MLCFPDKLASILSCWLKSLEDYIALLRSSSLIPNTTSHLTDTPSNKVPSLVTPPPPYSSLSPTVITSLTTLVTLCAELGIYSSKNGAASPQPVAPSCAQLLVVKDVAISSLDPVGMASELHDPECTLEDFIGHYSEVLDWSRVRYLLARQEWGIRERGWWALIRAGGESHNFIKAHDVIHAFMYLQATA